MTPTPSDGVRRRRDSNDVDFNLQDDIIIAWPAGTAPITPATRKRLKASCEEATCHFDMDPSQLTSFAEVHRITNYQIIFYLLMRSHQLSFTCLSTWRHTFSR